MNDNHRALITPGGDNVNDVIYANYEKDDVSFTNEPIDKRWITDRKKTQKKLWYKV